MGEKKFKVKNEVSAGGIVYKKSKIKNQKLKIEWLVVQHSQHKGWVFPKGLIGDIKSGEKMEEAAVREVEEEGGVKAKIVYEKPVKVKYMYRFGEYLVKKTVYYFLMEYLSGEPKNHDWEVSEAKFLSEEEVKKILTYPSDKKAFEEILLIFKTHFI
ncbi:MAG: NUDIX domain-containing protein [Microgenomates group bacterium]